MPLKLIKTNQKIKLNRGGYFNYYDHSIVGLVAVAIFLFLHLQYVGFSFSSMLLLPLVMLFYAMFITVLRYQRLNFYKIELTLTEDQFLQSTQCAALKLDWRINNLSSKKLIAFRPPEFLKNEFEKIIIIRNSNHVLINSNVDTDTSKTNYSKKRNQENINQFVYYAQLVLKGKKKIKEEILAEKETKEEAFWDESEWTLKNVFMRVTGYGVALVFLLLGIFFIQENSIAGLFMFLFFIAVCYFYIRIDLQIIMTKYQRNKSRE